MKKIKTIHSLKILLVVFGLALVHVLCAEENVDLTIQSNSLVQENAQRAVKPSLVKLDALELYREGRALESAQRYADARKKYLKSAEVCREEIKENSRNIESYVVLGWSLIRLEQYSEAIKISNTALTISPKENRITETLAEAYFYLDNYTESLKLFEQYVNALPNGDRASTAYFFIGDIYRLKGKYEHADIAYSMAVRKSPGIALWWYRLGMVRELAGKKEEAKIAYGKALEYRPIYQEASDALRRL